MSRRKRGAAAFIPIDLHEEILYRLPADILVNFKRVSKEWNRLISSPRFIEKHLVRSISDCNGARIIIAYNSGTEIIDSERNISRKIPLGDVHLFLGSCDGLVLCWLRNGKISAFNPSTGKFVVRTPNPSIRNDIINIQDNKWFICSWFGHHPSTGEYVLVIADWVVSPNLTIVFNVYSLSRNTNNPLLSSSTHQLIYEYVWGFSTIGTFLHGQLHCAVGVIGANGSFEVVILVHSFQTNGNIERMHCPAKSCPTLGVVDGCLSIICIGAEAYELWMMKEYGVKESWTKFANIEGYKIIYDHYILNVFIPIVFYPNGYVILKGNDGSGITKYNFGNSEAKILKSSTCSSYTGIMCIDSLVSPESRLVGFGGKGSNS